MKVSVALLLSLATLISPSSSSSVESRQRLLDEDREITYNELSIHSSYETGLWAALDGVVYDITDFMHPGGVRKILKVGGKDATVTYMENYKRTHPLTIEQVVRLDGIKRLGVLKYVYSPGSDIFSPVDTPTSADSVRSPKTDVPVTIAPVVAAVTVTEVPIAPVSEAPVAGRWIVPATSVPTKEYKDILLNSTEHNSSITPTDPLPNNTDVTVAAAQTQQDSSAAAMNPNMMKQGCVLAAVSVLLAWF
jgi:cytochrome b involved in lipid metabolism